jgi:hypothetical protein
MEVSDQLHDLAALPPEKDPGYPLDTRLGGPQSRSGPGGEEKIPIPYRDLNPPSSSPYVNFKRRPAISCSNLYKQFTDKIRTKQADSKPEEHWIFSTSECGFL